MDERLAGGLGEREKGRIKEPLGGEPAMVVRSGEVWRVWRHEA